MNRDVMCQQTNREIHVKRTRHRGRWGITPKGKDVESEKVKKHGGLTQKT